MIVIIYSILLGIEVLIVCTLISNAIPFGHNPVWDMIFTRLRPDTMAKRDLLLYAVFMCSCFGIYATILVLQRKYHDKMRWLQNLNRLVLVQGLWVFAELYAAYKIIMDNSPFWARTVLYSSLVASNLNKIFWPEVSAFCKGAWPRLEQWGLSVFRGWRGTAAGVLFIISVIAMTDPQAVVAQLYMGDQFHVWDLDCLGVVYGLFHGLLPDVDIFSPYGFGMPVLLAGIMKLFGGFDYVNVMKSLLLLGIVYFSIWFWILRRWFYSGLMAFAAIVMGMRAALFPTFFLPSVWVSLTASVLRLCFDVLLFAFLYKHLTTNRKIFLWLAAATAGLGMYHMISTGAELLITLLAYMGVHFIIPHIRSRMANSKWAFLSLARIIFLGPLVMLVMMWLTVGGNVFKPSFWGNVMEYHMYFANGLVNHYLTFELQAKHFLFVALGLGLVLFYAGSVLYAVHLLYCQKADYKITLAVPLGIYGLCLQAYYIETAMPYITFALPAVFLCFFWLDHACRKMALSRQNQAGWAALGVSFFALFSAPTFIAYPNIYNLSRNPIVDPDVRIKIPSGSYYFNQMYNETNFPEILKVPYNSLGEKDEKLKFENDFQTDKQLVDYYRQETDFSRDTSLIRRLTPAGARVPLISSFEILILSQADRKPFFYYFPYLSSRLMRTRSFVTSTLVSYPQLEKMIRQLEQEKPEYVFLQRVFLTPQVPGWYGYQFEDCIELIRYVEAHYQEDQIGEYLVAMKRIR